MDNIAIFCAKYLVFAIPLIYVWLLLKSPKRQRTELALAFVLAGTIAVILAKLAGSLHDSPRPFVTDGSTALISHGNDNGFPSEHTIFAMTITTLIYFYGRRLFILSLALTLLVAWGRVAVHVHHGVDVLAGLAIGIVAGWLGYWLAKKILSSKPNETTKTKAKTDEPRSSI